ncbi:helix-turn-helix domain-containing protein [Luteolibacter soli]|uniref:Helix-turn-helix transcriptional regulator n=1 Tax=Luteolibacter soli TaxID=3135280 RepID=A0ABU9B3C6_9BACT
MASLNIIGERVKARREARNWTQDHLAAACQRLGWDISRVTLAKVETGMRRVGDGEVVVLAAALRCKASDLLDKVPLKLAMKTVRQGQATL